MFKANFMTQFTAPSLADSPEVSAASQTATPAATAYQAPAVERVVTIDDIAREVFYAGSISIPNPPVDP